jgi:hypothetical protein
MQSDPREQLALVERAEAAPYLNYPPTPWWYPPVAGLWAAGMIGTFGWWRGNAGLFIGSLAVLLALEAAFLVWMRRRHGAFPMPGRGTPPAEIAAVWRGYFGCLPVIAAVVALVWWRIGIPAAAPVAFVLVTAGLAVYEQRYARAASRARERLA